MIPREPQGHLPVASQIHRSSESQDRGLERKAKMETEKVKDIKREERWWELWGELRKI